MLAAASALALGVGIAGPAAAYQNEEAWRRSVPDLPRPGYEPRRITVGTAIISPTLDALGTYNSNVFATPEGDGDFLLVVTPAVSIERNRGNLRLRGDLFGSLYRYADNKQENIETYGIGLGGRFDPTRETTLSAAARYERRFERRDEPEAENDPREPPNKVDFLTADFNFTQRFGRAGLTLKAARDEIDYLARDEADRDLVTSRASLRGFVTIRAGMDAFVEPYYNRRDARAPVDRNGVDRDTKTVGALAGASVEISSSLTGEIGVGLFRANPDDPLLRSFSGLAASGSISWRPRVRTAVTADFFRGDVATIRAGAIGRIDTRASIRLDQEIRHNLIMTAGAGIRRTTYRGRETAALNIYRLDVGLAYLLSRHVSLTADLALAKRSTRILDERFERALFSLGVRLTY